MRTILVVYPGDSYEHEVQAESIRTLRRQIKEDTGKPAPKGTIFRYKDPLMVYEKTEDQKKKELVEKYPEVFLA